MQAHKVPYSDVSNMQLADVRSSFHLSFSIASLGMFQIFFDIHTFFSYCRSISLTLLSCSSHDATEIIVTWIKCRIISIIDTTKPVKAVSDSWRQPESSDFGHARIVTITSIYFNG